MKKNVSSSKKIFKMIGTTLLTACVALLVLGLFHTNDATALFIGFVGAKAIGSGIAAKLSVFIPIAATKSSPKVTAANNQPKDFGNLGIAAPQVDHQFEDPAAHAAVNKSVLPLKFTCKVVGAVNATAEDTTIMVFNPSVFAPVVRATGAGADNITYVWSDKNDGLTIERVLFLSRFGIGAIMYGFSIQMNFNNGTADSTGLGNCSPKLGAWDCFGNFTVAENFVASSNETRKDTNFNLFVTRCAHNLSGTTQFSFVLPFNGATSADTTLITFYLTPNFEL